MEMVTKTLKSSKIASKGYNRIVRFPLPSQSLQTALKFMGKNRASFHTHPIKSLLAQNW